MARRIEKFFFFLLKFNWKKFQECGCLLWGEVMKEIAKDIRSIILTVIVTILYPVLINEKPNMFETINLLLIITLSICVCNIIVSYYSDKRYLSNLYQYLFLAWE